MGPWGIKVVLEIKKIFVNWFMNLAQISFFSIVVNLVILVLFKIHVRLFILVVFISHIQF